MGLFHSKMGQGIFFFARACAYTRSKITRFAVIFSLFITPTLLFAAPRTVAEAKQDIQNSRLDRCLPAIEFLGRSHDASVVPALAQAFSSESRALVRRYIVHALRRIGSNKAQPTFLAALNDSDAQVRQSAVVALSRFSDAKSQQALVNHAANESDFGVTAHLIQALGRATDAKSKDTLKTLSAGKNPELKRMAQNELDQRTKREKK